MLKLTNSNKSYFQSAIKFSLQKYNHLHTIYEYKRDQINCGVVHLRASYKKIRIYFLLTIILDIFLSSSRCSLCKKEQKNLSTKSCHAVFLFLSLLKLCTAFSKKIFRFYLESKSNVNYTFKIQNKRLNY